MTLPLRILGHEGEPAHGLLLRLAHRHGEEDPRAFAAELGIAWQNTPATLDPAAIARASGLSLEAIAFSSPIIEPKARRVRLAGEILYLNDWSVRGRRYCPACFLDDRLEAMSGRGSVAKGPWHRTYWDIRTYDVCHIHRLRLHDACPTCGTPLGWRRSVLDVCECGADLAAGPSSSGDASVSQFIAARMGFTRDAPCGALENLCLGEALPVIERLGSAIKGGYRAKKPKSDAKGRAEARTIGLAGARDWPRALISALDDIVNRPDLAVAPSGVIGAYGWIYASWAVTETAPRFGEALRGCLRKHAIANGIAQEGEVLFGERFPVGRGIAAVVRELGSSYRRITRALAGEGAMPRGHRRGVATSLSNSWLVQTRTDASGTLTLQETAKTLGIGRIRAREIVAAGLIEPVDFLGQRRFRATDIENFLTSLGRQQALASASSNEKTRALPAACQSMGVRLVHALEALMQERLSVEFLEPGGIGLQAFHVSLKALGDLRPSPRARLTEAVVARRLHIHADTVRFLARSGHLTEKADGHAVMTTSAVEEFDKTFVSCAHLAKQTGLSPRAVMKRLTARKIDPAFSPPTLRNVIYRRSNVDYAVF